MHRGLHTCGTTASAAFALATIGAILMLPAPARAQPAADEAAAVPALLPGDGALRPGRIVRDPAGALVLRPPTGADEGMATAGPVVALPPPAQVLLAPPGPASTDLPQPTQLKPGRVLRSGAGALTLAARNGHEIRVCTPQTATPDCNHLSLADAVAAARPGDTILLTKGIYEEAAVVTVPGLTIRAAPGAQLRRRAAEGKAALVIRADDVVVDGLECSEISVPDGNGACVRIEGRNLTLKGVYFHDNQEGVLGGVGGWVLVEDSVFERNGGRRGYAHGLYIAPSVEVFTFRRNKVLATKDEGQGVKSRAQKTIIEDSVIAGLGSRDSRAIDIPNGGDIVIRRNVLEKGPKSSNSQMIGLGLEGNLHPESRAVVENNLIIFDDRLPDWIKIVNDTIPIAAPYGTVVSSRIPAVTLNNNAIVGRPRLFDGEGVTETNTHLYATRARANLPAYPALPEPGAFLNGRLD